MAATEELAYFDENIPCLAACPVHTNAGMYVAAIADGDDEQAYLTARMPNPFASVCGRVCAAPCEDACRRGEIDRPIAIRALKRFITEQFGPERGNGRTWEKVAAPPSVERPESIGIVGGGPAGMACAHDLRRLGYKVTVYEATEKLGGAMWLGIPEYRLDRDVLAGDIEAIVGLGVEVHTNTKLGTDVTLDELRERHDALFLGIGATLGRGLDLEGAEADGVFKAIEFLINMNRGFEVDIGERVIVVGGGDVAMDAARTALRAADYESSRDALPFYDDSAERSSITEALDVARTAVRAGARDITVISLESRDEMPAHDFEIEEAVEEGIAFVHRRGPARVVTDGDAVAGLETTLVTSVFDEEGRFAPEFDTDDLKIYDADTIILAIGQAIDLDSLGDDGPEISPRRTIQIDPVTGGDEHARRLVGRRRRQGTSHADRRGRRRTPFSGRHPSATSAVSSQKTGPERWFVSNSSTGSAISTTETTVSRCPRSRRAGAWGWPRSSSDSHLNRHGARRIDASAASPTSSWMSSDACCVRCAPTSVRSM